MLIKCILSGDFIVCGKGKGKKAKGQGKRNSRDTVLNDNVERVIRCSVTPVEDNSYHSRVFCTGMPGCRLRFIREIQSFIPVATLVHHAYYFAKFQV